VTNQAVLGSWGFVNQWTLTAGAFQPDCFCIESSLQPDRHSTPNFSPPFHSELWLGNSWLGANSIPLVMASLFVMLSGAYLEWLVALMSKASFRVQCLGRMLSSSAPVHNFVQSTFPISLNLPA
jgi:hypothetical protein